MPAVVAVDRPFKAVVFRPVDENTQVDPILSTVALLYFENESGILHMRFFPGHVRCFCQVLRLNRLRCEGGDKGFLLA